MAFNIHISNNSLFPEIQAFSSMNLNTPPVSAHHPIAKLLPHFQVFVTVSAHFSVPTPMSVCLTAGTLPYDVTSAGTSFPSLLAALSPTLSSFCKISLNIQTQDPASAFPSCSKFLSTKVSCSVMVEAETLACTMSDFSACPPCPLSRGWTHVPSGQAYTESPGIPGLWGVPFNHWHRIMVF